MTGTHIIALLLSFADVDPQNFARIDVGLEKFVKHRCEHSLFKSRNSRRKYWYFWVSNVKYAKESGFYIKETSKL